MKAITRETMTDGARWGIAAGLVFGLTEMLVALFTVGLPLLPLRMAAGVVAGGGAVEPTSSVAAMCVLGLIVHLVLSSAYGTIYGWAASALHARSAPGPAVALGVAFGALLWLLNFQIIAGLAYPWFLDSSQPVQLLIHALGFGLPLGLMFGSAERHPRRHVASPRT